MVQFHYLCERTKIMKTKTSVRIILLEITSIYRVSRNKDEYGIFCHKANEFVYIGTRRECYHLLDSWIS